MPLAIVETVWQFDELGVDMAVVGVVWVETPFVYVLISPSSVQIPVAYCWNDEVEPSVT